MQDTELREAVSRMSDVQTETLKLLEATTEQVNGLAHIIKLLHKRVVALEDGNFLTVQEYEDDKELTQRLEDLNPFD